MRESAFERDADRSRPQRNQEANSALADMALPWRRMRLMVAQRARKMRAISAPGAGSLAHHGAFEFGEGPEGFITMPAGPEVSIASGRIRQHQRPARFPSWGAYRSGRCCQLDEKAANQPMGASISRRGAISGDAVRARTEKLTLT